MRRSFRVLPTPWQFAGEVSERVGQVLPVAPRLAPRRRHNCAHDGPRQHAHLAGELAGGAAACTFRMASFMPVTHFSVAS